MDAENIYVRSFYDIGRNLLSFCENNHILCLEDQVIETYHHFMNLLLKDYFNPFDARNLIDVTENHIQNFSDKGHQLAIHLQKIESEYQKENSAPYVRGQIFNKIKLNQIFSKTDTIFSEYIIMMHWNMLETMENVIVNTFGKGKNYATKFQGDSLSWFLNQQLPAAFVEVFQKAEKSRNHFLIHYQEKLSSWIGWLTGFYSIINQHSTHQEIQEKASLFYS